MMWWWVGEPGSSRNPLTKKDQGKLYNTKTKKADTHHLLSFFKASKQGKSQSWVPQWRIAGRLPMQWDHQIRSCLRWTWAVLNGHDRPLQRGRRRHRLQIDTINSLVRSKPSMQSSIWLTWVTLKISDHHKVQEASQLQGIYSKRIRETNDLSFLFCGWGMTQEGGTQNKVFVFTSHLFIIPSRGGLSSIFMMECVVQQALDRSFVLWMKTLKKYARPPPVEPSNQSMLFVILYE